jgi:hypothetical protein
MSRRTAPAPHGSAIVAMIVVLVIAELVIIGIVLGGARDQDLSMRRMESTHAFYAAEAGINMAMREYADQADYDNDGAIGSISNDGNAANDPQLGPATLSVSLATVSGQLTLTSVGHSGEAHRKAVVVVGSGQTDRNIDGKQIGSRISVSDSGRVAAILAHVKGPAPMLVRYALYGESSGEPGALLAQTASAPVGSNLFHWQLITTPETWIASGLYWLALGAEHADVYYSYEGGGQTRIKTRDTIASGFASPWGASNSSATQTLAIRAVLFRNLAGPIDFDSDSEYQNSNPPTNGLFRDLTQPSKINRGPDISNNSTHYTAVNFGSGPVADAVTLYDINPRDTTPTDFDGSISVEADMLVRGAGTKFIGFGALINAMSGQDGLALVVQDRRGNDYLELHRLPQSGNVGGTAAIEQSSGFRISRNQWYCLRVSFILVDTDLHVNATIWSHTNTRNPNSALNGSPLATLTYLTDVASLSGLPTSGQLGLIFDGTTNQGQGSVTNVRILSDATFVPPVGTESIVSWSEQP